MVEQETLRRSARLDPVAVSAGAARRVIRQALAEAGETAAVDAAELAVSELVSNAILHAATPVEVSVEVSDDAVTVSVRDFHPSLPAQRSWGTAATTGRGLALVAALTDGHGVEAYGEHGKAVWFRIDRTTRGTAVDPGDWRTGALNAELEQPAGTSVILTGVPVRLWAAGQQHWEAVLRELYLLEQTPQRTTAPDLVAAGHALATLSAAVDRAAGAAVRASAWGEPLPTARLSPLPTVPEQVDAELGVPAAEHGGFGALQDALDLGAQLGAEGRLLIRPALPEVVALRDWACEQVVAQANGVPPTAWTGIADARFAEPPTGRYVPPVPAWDNALVRDSTRSVVAADDNNRLVAVSGPAGTMLGWDPEELTGRRVVTIVPPALREAHVAGFTRHLTTGETHAIGVRLQLPVLHADGSEVLCHFLIERAAAERGRAIYLCFIDPVS